MGQRFACGYYVVSGELEVGEFALTPAHAEVLHEPALGDGSVRYLFVGDGPFDFIVDGVDLYNKS